MIVKVVNMVLKTIRVLNEKNDNRLFLAIDSPVLKIRVAL